MKRLELRPGVFVDVSRPYALLFCAIYCLAVNDTHHSLFLDGMALLVLLTSASQRAAIAFTGFRDQAAQPDLGIFSPSVLYFMEVPICYTNGPPSSSILARSANSRP